MTIIERQTISIHAEDLKVYMGLPAKANIDDITVMKNKDGTTVYCITAQVMVRVRGRRVKVAAKR